MTRFFLSRFGKYESWGRIPISGLLIVTMSVVIYGQDVAAEIYGDYVGARTCADCHGEIVDGWRQTPHARAFDSLVKSKQQDLPACIQCHVVGYGRAGGFLDGALTMELAGVQCESCHGLGKPHSTDPDSENIVAVPAEEVCRTCHTTGQDPDFDIHAKMDFVHQNGGTTALAKPTDSEGPPVNASLHLEKPVNAFDVVEEGAPVIAYIPIKNTGPEAINITDVIST